MRLERLAVVLRARSSWEAMELGTALVRRHAGAVWKPWLALSAPVFVACTLLGAWLDNYLLAAVLMWWLKPLFERVPLYVISRAAFGQVPGTVQTLRAQWHWRGGLAYLGWRRLSPARALLVPMEALEGGQAGQRRERRAVLARASYLHACLLTTVYLHFEWMLQLAGVALVFLFVPFELLPDSLRTAWALVGQQTPSWVWIAGNALSWLAMTLIGPFYVGAGFGLYLNRRMELEAWDIEISLRRLRQRLRQGGSALVLVLAAALPVLPASAQDAGNAPAQEQDEQEHDPQPPATPATVFGPDLPDIAGFRQAMARAYEDPALGAQRQVQRWRPRQTEDRQSAPPLGWMQGVAKLASLLAEAALWIIVAALVLALLLTARWWWPWLRGHAPRPRPAPPPVEQHPLLDEEPLPQDIVAQARRLWAAGQARQALALLYRASVAALGARLDRELPPGATEAQCLRAARSLPAAEDRSAFADIVRVWQYAAYAGRLPDDGGFEQLLARLQQRFGWPR